MIGTSANIPAGFRVKAFLGDDLTIAAAAPVTVKPRRRCPCQFRQLRCSLTD